MTVTVLGTSVAEGANAGNLPPCPSSAMSVDDSSQIWTPFVECLLAKTKECVELRAFSAKGSVADVPVHTRDAAVITQFCLKHNSVNHVYVGAATRIKSGGTKEHCREAIWTWADIDFKDFPGGETDARERLADFHIPPSIVILTGGGLHCYWLLTVPVDLVKHGQRLEEALRRIAYATGADKSRTELASMMRMPGTRNMKPERHGAIAYVEKMDLSVKYNIDCFLSLPAVPIGGHSSIDALANAIVKGNRDAGAFAYINAVIKTTRKATDDEGLALKVKELLLKAGGDDLDSIIAKISTWITTAHALFDGDLKPTTLALADAINEAYCRLVVCVGGQLRIYRDGYWPLADDLLLRKQIAELSRPYTTPTCTAQALQNLKDLTARKDFTSRPDLICVVNGTLDPETALLSKHDPSHSLVNHLNIAWNPEASCELWFKTLTEIFAGDSDADAKMVLLQMWFGYCLVPDTRYHKFLWLVGAGANGKSLVLQVLEAVVGGHNCTHLMLTRLGRDFVRASLQDKLVNISSEMRAEDTVSDSLLKAIVAGDTIEAEIKYGPSISFRPVARLVAATNELPRLLDTSHGFKRRVMIIPFLRVFAEQEQDRDRIQNLWSELPGILRWAVEGLKKLRQHGGFVIPESSATAVQDYLRDSDPVQQFAEENLVGAPVGGLAPKTIYTCYEAWAKERGFKIMNIATFGKRLAALGLKHRLSNGKKLWCVDFAAPATVTWLTAGSQLGQVGEVEDYAHQP